jgi:hypothetical protein
MGIRIDRVFRVSSRIDLKFRIVVSRLCRENMIRYETCNKQKLEG